MKTDICCVAVLMCTLGIVFNVAAAENNSSLAPLIMEMPDMPPQYAQVMLVQASQTQRDQVNTDRTIGICKLVENPIRMEGDGYSAINGLIPLAGAQAYFQIVEHREVLGPSVVTVLQNPEHGTLEPVTGGMEGYGGYWYLPKTDYFGPDRATFQVEMDGKKIKMQYFFKVLHGVADNYTEEQYKNLCPNGDYWKISLNPDDPNAVSYTFEMPSQLTSAYAGLANVNLIFADLAGGALGQTTGTNITLDDNAAGYSWFIDTTPWDNSEYLPTSNPSEWVAKAGSAAEGKMDMLSVLLHEYGHALGIDHSTDSHDYMTTTLTTGVRRMPSAEELALMQELVEQ